MQHLRKISLKLFYNVFYLFGNPPWDTGQSPPELLEFIQQQPPGRALDLGCGTGTNSLTLARNGWQVVGVDFAPPAIHAARRKIRGRDLQVEFQVDDVTRLEGVNGRFDLVLDIGCFHSLTQDGRQRYTANLSRLLEPGGAYLLYAFISTPGEESNGITEEDLKRFQQILSLERREEGTERGLRASGWFWFRRPSPESG